jgi:hypothetical protein
LRWCLFSSTKCPPGSDSSTTSRVLLSTLFPTSRTFFQQIVGTSWIYVSSLLDGRRPRFSPPSIFQTADLWGLPHLIGSFSALMYVLVTRHPARCYMWHLSWIAEIILPGKANKISLWKDDHGQQRAFGECQRALTRKYLAALRNLISSSSVFNRSLLFARARVIFLELAHNPGARCGDFPGQDSIRKGGEWHEDTSGDHSPYPVRP